MYHSKQTLTNEQLYVLSLIRDSFGYKQETNTISTLSTIDISVIRSILRRNGIILSVFRSLPSDMQSMMQVQYYEALKQSLIQDKEGNRILHLLNESGFQCIALKGWEMRRLYPNLNFRHMADIDILVKPYRFKQIKSIMKTLGYEGDTSESYWKHDNFRKDIVTVEVHKRLTDDSGIIQEWERQMWNRAKKDTEGYVYHMSPEDFYIFHFLHLHKDFMNGSLGLKRIIDTWLLHLDETKLNDVKKVLNDFGIGKFYERMVRLSKVVMGQVAMDNDSIILLQHAFKHGVYGTDTSYKAGRIARMSKHSISIGKIKSTLVAIFPPFRRMRAQFPELRKLPFLLPFCWVKRIIRFLQDDVNTHKANLVYDNVSREDYEEMKSFFAAGGVVEEE